MGSNRSWEDFREVVSSSRLLISLWEFGKMGIIYNCLVEWLLRLNVIGTGRKMVAE
jgi:hypothetical protein